MDKTLLKGLNALETLAGLDGGPRSIDEMAEILGLSRSNTHRTLQTLVHAGYVVKDPVLGGYRCSMKMYELGARQLHRQDLRKLAPAYMEKLAVATGDTVHLSILDGKDVVYIDKIDSLQPVRAYTIIGGRAPAYAVATGKALLARQSDDYLRQHCSDMQHHTEKTLESCEALKTELALIRQTGCAFNYGEWSAEVGGLAAVVFDEQEKPLAALGVSGPLSRLHKARMQELAPDLIRCAAEISRALGYRQAYPGEKA